MVKSKRYLIENIQFNHVDLFISSTLSTFMGLFFNNIALITACIFSGISLSANLFYLPLIYINLFLLGMGTALILATIKIYLDDIVHLWAMITLFGLWTSGVFLRGELFLEQLPILLYIQPFIGIIINMRKITMYSMPPDFFMLGVNMVVGLLVLVFGAFIFIKNSQNAIENL